MITIITNNSLCYIFLFLILLLGLKTFDKSSTNRQHTCTQHSYKFRYAKLPTCNSNDIITYGYLCKKITTKTIFTHFSFVAYSSSMAHFSFMKCRILSQNSVPFCVWVRTLSNWSWTARQQQLSVTVINKEIKPPLNYKKFVNDKLLYSHCTVEGHCWRKTHTGYRHSTWHAKDVFLVLDGMTSSPTGL